MSTKTSKGKNAAKNTTISTGATITPTQTGPEKVNPGLENSETPENGSNVHALSTTGTGENIVNAKHQEEFREAKNESLGGDGNIPTTDDNEGRHIEVPQNPSFSHVEALKAATSDNLSEEIKLPLGRPIDPTSARQKRLAQYEAKKTQNGGLHRGRPKDPNSANAIKEAARQERLAKMKEAALKANQLNEKEGVPANIVAMVKTGDKIEPSVVAADPAKVAEMMEANEAATV